MKRIFMVTTSLIIATQLFAQAKPYNVVFDLTTADTATHHRVIRWINGILASYPDAKIEVVFYGKSLPMVETNLSTKPADIKTLAAKNVTFAVCEQAMKAHNLDKSMLLPGVKTVPDGIYELVLRQAEGFGYIKVAN